MLSEQDKRDIQALVKAGHDSQIVTLRFQVLNLEAGCAQQIEVQIALAERYHILATSRRMQLHSSTQLSNQCDPVVQSWYEEALALSSLAVQAVDALAKRAHAVCEQIRIGATEHLERAPRERENP